MRHLSQRKLNFLRLQHIFAIMLILTSNLGSLVTPVAAKTQTQGNEKPVARINQQPAPVARLHQNTKPNKIEPENVKPQGSSLSLSCTTSGGHFSAHPLQNPYVCFTSIYGTSTTGAMTYPVELNGGYHAVLKKHTNILTNRSYFIVSVTCSSNCSANIPIYYNVKVVPQRFESICCGLVSGGATTLSGPQSASTGGSCPAIVAGLSSPCGALGLAGAYTVSQLGNSSFSSFGFSVTVPQVSMFGGFDFNWDVTISAAPIVPDDSTKCPTCGPYSSTPIFTADPINVRTGNFSFPVDDLTLPTSDGPLSLKHTYVSQAIDQYTTPFSPGWTHSQDIRLVFPNDPAGKPGFVLFKDHSSNMYLFFDKGNNTYTPYQGLNMSLTKNGGDPTTYTIADEATQSTYEFDAAGKLVSKTDEAGNTLLYTYNGDDKLYRVTAEGDERYLEFNYDETSGKLIGVQDNTSRGVSFEYDEESEDLISYTDVLGETWTYEYDSSHALTRVLDPDGHTRVRNEYYPVGKFPTRRISKQFDGEDNLVVNLTYENNGTTKETDSLGHQKMYTYNSLGEVTGVQNGAAQTESTKAFNINFRPSSIMDGASNTTSLVWSSNGANLTKITDALGNHTNIEYNNANKPKEVVRPDGKITSYTYEGNLLSSISTGDQTTSYTYKESGPEGLLETVTGPNGLVTRYEYDEHGQQTKIIRNYDEAKDPNEDGVYNLTTEYEYDSLGRVSYITAPSPANPAESVVTYNEYNNAGRLILTKLNYDESKSENEDNLYNITTRMYYDVRGNYIATQDALGLITRTYYDDAGRVVTTIRNLTGQEIEEETPPARGTDGENIRMDNVYDTAGNLIAVIDHNEVVTRTYYDAANRPVTVIRNLVGQSYSDPDPDGVSYSDSYPDRNVRSDTVYDNAGRVIATIDNKGIVTRTYYDELNRPETVVQNLTGQSISTATPPTCGTEDENENLCSDTIYDVNGRTIATQDALGTITRTYYDELDRPYLVVRNLTGWDVNVSTPPRLRRPRRCGAQR